MTTYYDIPTSILVSVADNKIIAVARKPSFVFDHKVIITPEELPFYGRIGTAYHSGKRVSQLSRYLGKQAIINQATSIKTGVVKNSCVCDRFPDIESLRQEKLSTFFTDNIDLMPVLGYVVVNAKIREPNPSLFEQPCHLEGEASIQVLESLQGDNIGQMVQLLKQGKPVYNSIYTTAFSNPFYGCTLSLLPLKNQFKHVVVMAQESFQNYFPKTDATISELSKSVPVVLDCDKEVFGFDRISVYSGNQPFLLSGFFGFLRYFTSAEVDFVYSYQGQHSDIVCGYNKVVEKRQG